MGFLALAHWRMRHKVTGYAETSDPRARTQEKQMTNVEQSICLLFLIDSWSTAERSLVSTAVGFGGNCDIVLGAT